MYKLLLEHITRESKINMKQFEIIVNATENLQHRVIALSKAYERMTYCILIYFTCKFLYIILT